jgi:hypothetical protein
MHRVESELRFFPPIWAMQWDKANGTHCLACDAVNYLPSPAGKCKDTIVTIHHFPFSIGECATILGANGNSDCMLVNLSRIRPPPGPA